MGWLKLARVMQVYLWCFNYHSCLFIEGNKKTKRVRGTGGELGLIVNYIYFRCMSVTTWGIGVSDFCRYFLTQSIGLYLPAFTLFRSGKEITFLNL